MGRRRKAISSGSVFTKIVVTCEHASNAVPKGFAGLFRSAAARAALHSHRGWDPGALPLARALARRFHAPLLTGKWSRLVVDLNRSPGNHRGGILSEFMAPLSRIEQAMVIDRLHVPHWHAVEEEIGTEIEAGGTVLHLGVHSFTPVLRGVTRTADFALLYDPRRAIERDLCGRWLEVLADHPESSSPSRGATHVAGEILQETSPERERVGSSSRRVGQNHGTRRLRSGLVSERFSRVTTPLRLRRNYPYFGTSDGLTTHLRKRFPPGRYAGVEIEFNQGLAGPSGRVPTGVERVIIESLGRVLGAG